MVKCKHKDQQNPTLNNGQWSGPRTRIMWEEQLLDPPNDYIKSVIVP